MFFRLAFSIFLLVNGAPTDLVGVAIVQHDFPTEQSCTDYVVSDLGKSQQAAVEQHAAAVVPHPTIVVPECVGIDPADVPKEPTPQRDRDPVNLPSRPGQRGA